jgi:hypothetical protein
MRGYLRLVLSTVLFGLPCTSLICQNAPDSAVSLTIRFTGGISQFHVGEKIPIELAFTSSAPETFELNPRNYDRSGRLDLDAFHVTPEGRDPLRNYFQGFEGVFMSGGLSSMPQYLTAEPQTLIEELNEWVAIDEPGHYSVYVTSSRVGRSGQSFTNPISAQSNTLEFDVIDADNSWQQQTLLAALAVLNDPNSKPEEKTTALRTLQFLDSPASMRELARRLTQPGAEHCWECSFGLISSHHQKLVVQELESLMAAPETAITSGFLELLAKTKFMLDHDPMPPEPKSEAGQEAYMELQNKRLEEFETLQTSLLMKTASLLSVKTGAARAATVQTLLTASPNGDGKTKSSVRLSDADIEAALLGLPSEGQFNLLKYFWPQIKRPMMVGVLEKILDQRVRDQELRGVALLRLDELDHQKAVARVLEVIEHPKSGQLPQDFDPMLRILPDNLMPQFDNMLAARLEKKNSSTFSLDSQLIAHYATRAILPRVKAVYQNSKEDADCEAVDGLISYFLRVDTEFGLRQLKDATLSCNRRSLAMAVRMKRWSALEPVMIARLNDLDLGKARNAAETLGEFGGAEAKRAMLERLRRFHEQWARREAEFQSTPGTPNDITEASSFQFGLLQATGTAQGWILDDAEMTEMEQLAIGQAKENVASWHPPGSEKTAVAINLIDLDDFTLTVDRYTVHDLNTLRTKLAQFPSGTRFVFLDFQTNQDPRSEPVIQAIHELAQQHGFSVETPGNQ